MWLKRYSGLLRLHATRRTYFSLLLENSCRASRTLHLANANLLFAAAPLFYLHAAPTPRTPFAFYNYRHRYPVHGTGYASLFLNPCASVYTQLGQAAVRLLAFHCTSPLSKLS